MDDPYADFEEGGPGSPLGNGQPPKTPSTAIAVATPEEHGSREGPVEALRRKALDKASMLDLTAEEDAALSADFPDTAFRRGAGGKQNLIYIEHANLRARLISVLGRKFSLVTLNQWVENFEFTNNEGELVQVTRVYCHAMLVVRGCWVAEATDCMDYYPKNAASSHGDAIEGAKTAAFRRCCKEFCVGLQAWDKAWCEGWSARNGGAASGSQGGGQPAHSGPRPNCPKCGTNAAVIVGKPEYGGGFVCFKKKNGCGHSWQEGAAAAAPPAPPAAAPKAPATKPPHLCGNAEELGAAWRAVPDDMRKDSSEAFNRQADELGLVWEQELGYIPIKPAVDDPFIAEWAKRLDPLTMNMDRLNSEIIPAFKAIPGKMPYRAKLWKMTIDFAEKFGVFFEHGSKKFAQKKPD